MAKLKQKLTNAISSGFKGADVKLAGFTRGHRVGGTVVWKGFEGKAQIDRQVELRRVIDKAIGPDEQLQVSFILTVTPDELASITAKN